MIYPIPATALEMRSLVTDMGELRLSLERHPVPTPADDEVIVRVEATPINPSDQGLMFGAADLSTASRAGTHDTPVLIAQTPPERMKSVASRVGLSLPVGHEGAGTVVAAGGAAEATALLGRTVAVFGTGLYAQYRVAKAAHCLALPPGTPAAAGASAFINPLTALGMVETMRRDGHRAIVHAPAASNLGQILLRICAKDGIPLVNIVRSAAQRDLLTRLGATHVCDSSSPSFAEDLVDAIRATGATLAFDAIAGGTLASQVLQAMETVASRSLREYSRYGSTVHKQVYLYGSLDTGPTVLNRTFGLAWTIGGWLLWPFLQRIGPEAETSLRARIVAELGTTFASRYAKTISLAQALDPCEIAAYSRRATGEKVLIDPSR